MPASRAATSGVSPTTSAPRRRDLDKQMAPGNRIEIVGQIQSMDLAFRNLGIGLLFAAVLVYLLMVVNYQNFGDPSWYCSALPATLVRHRRHALRHRHDAQRPVADGRNHGGGRRLGELDPARHLRPRTAATPASMRAPPPSPPATRASGRS